MLEIEIDGKVLQVADGSTVMEAATQAGCYIPHFCYHKKLSIAASCRMCLVQVEKAPKPLPACATPVTPGMKVWTRSAQAVKAQAGVMEFLLINHPLDCPICDQGGECQLQDVAVGYGGVTSRYEEEKRVVANKDLGPLVSTDMTRCINCTRCVRFTTEIAGKMELGQAFRGEHAEIMPFIEQTVDSELSGNIIDLCPVGALTSKPFRFSARTWEMSRRRSVSPHDGLGSNLIVQTKHDRVKRVLPFENEAINECWLSDRDRFSYEALNSPERLTRPLIQRDGQWVEVDWQTAFQQITTRLGDIVSQSGPSALGALASAQCTLEELYLLQKWVRALGSDNVDFRLRQADFRADGKRTGLPWLGMPLNAIGRLNRLLMVGSFLRKDVPLLAQRLRQAARKGLKINVLASSAEDWLIPLANRCVVPPSALPNELAGILLALSKGLEQPVSEDVCNALPATPSAQAQAIAESLASGQKVAIWLGSEVLAHPRLAEIETLCREIARLTQGRFGVVSEGPNALGGYVAHAVPGVAGGLNAQTMLTVPRKAYVLMNLDPEFDTFDPALIRSALEKASLVVMLSAFKPASAAVSQAVDVLLPITPFAETSGSFINMEGRLQSFHAAVPPQGEARPGWKVLRALGAFMALPGFGQESSQAVLEEVLAMHGPLEAALQHSALEGVRVLVSPAQEGLERLTDVPLYRADPLVRRAVALHKTRDAAPPCARAHGRTLEHLGVKGGQAVRLRMGDGPFIELTMQRDDNMALHCVRVPAAHESTVALGPMSGLVHVERV
jgi:NADH-quinone oxidoreductase subunit G